MTDKKPRILCIDDSPDSLKLLKLMLQNNYLVATAENAREGLKMINEALPDVILLDVMMPDMDGYQLCSLLQKSEKTAYIPVIFVTALAQEKDMAKAFAVGGDDYIVKPVKKDILLNKINEFLEKNSQWANLRQDTRSWYERIQPASFIQFRENLLNRYGSDNETRYRISKIVPANIYAIGKEINISPGDMAKQIADFLNLPYASKINPDRIRLGVLPVAFSRHNHAVAIRNFNGEDAFVISNPFDGALIDSLMKFFSLDAADSLLITEPSNIDYLFSENLPRYNFEISGQTVDSFDLAAPSKAEIRKHPVIQVVNSILNAAVDERASDIHIEPKKRDAVVRFRIDGDLKDAFTLKTNTATMAISRFKVLGGLDIAVKRKPQDGSFAAVLKGRSFNIRLSTTFTPNGESLVIRMLEPYSEPKKLTELGMSEKQTETMKMLASKSSGIILIVGATGSGKTTTIYSVLSSVDYKKLSVLSVEDPVEYRIPFVNQQQVNDKTGATFNALLKAAVRQDPDVLFMGEVRDEFSAKLAFDFSSTGHLTITSMHTSNATTAIFRLERLGVDRGAMADNILAVVAQKLVKKLCPYCKQIVPVSPEEAEMFAPFTSEIPTVVAHPGGCSRCSNTGYIGREGVYEILEFTPEITDMVRDKLPISKIREFVRKRGDFLISTHAVTKAKDLVFSPQDIFSHVLVEETTAPPFPAEQPVPEPTAPAPAPPKQPAILVVEDDITSRTIITHLLEKNGYSVTTAEDGIEALLYLGKQGFDLILSDIIMPNLDGFKLLEMINQKGVKAPVIFLTSTSNPEDELKGLKMGAVDYIKKPINKDVLLLRIDNKLKERGR